MPGSKPSAVDLFFCSCMDADTDGHRTRAYRQSLFEWEKLEDAGIVNVHLLRPEHREQNRIFQMTRRIIAAHMATTEVFILADDDLIPAAGAVEAALQLMGDARYADFAMLSLNISNEQINPWRPKGRNVYEDDSVFEHEMCGGVRFVRRKSHRCVYWPPFVGPGYDREHCKALRALGYRVGYFRHLYAEHLGAGHSTVWTK